MAIGPGMQLFAGGAHARQSRHPVRLAQVQWPDRRRSGAVQGLAGLAVEISPGGANSATVPPVISGSAQLGQFSETPHSDLP
jgi:NitT/TauT family transport system substrate-binding protein